MDLQFKELYIILSREILCSGYGLKYSPTSAFPPGTMPSPSLSKSQDGKGQYIHSVSFPNHYLNCNLPFSLSVRLVTFMPLLYDFSERNQEHVLKNKWRCRAEEEGEEGGTGRGESTILSHSDYGPRHQVHQGGPGFS